MKQYLIFGKNVGLSKWDESITHNNLCAIVKGGNTYRSFYYIPKIKLSDLTDAHLKILRGSEEIFCTSPGLRLLKFF